ncbi:hypothetical protein VZT92_011257 [Zoarces viviparus]|uniref:Ig-like domain-containing protein n=1 Tax=Zoarces viviparus TaxID=48416 RepID=A0AAW1FAP4_ZOAVI
MAEFRWIVMSSFLMLQVLSFRAAATQYPSFTVRDGDEVTLPYKNVTRDQDECNSTTWLFTGSGNTVVPLFEYGKIDEAAKDKSDRLSVSENCSLIIKNVTDEDAGQYICRLFRSGQEEHQGEDMFHLFVVNMTEQKSNDEVMLSCSVWTHRECRHTVKWLNEGNQDDQVTSQRICSAGLRIKTSHLDQKSKSLLKCEVTHRYTGEVHQFTLSPQSSDDATKTTTKSPTILSTSTTRNKSEVTNNETAENNTNEKKPEGRWWILITVSVGVAAVLIITVCVIAWKRTKGNKRKTDDDVADPEEGVSYASVSFTKKTNSRARAHIQHDDEDEGDAVTYSTVKLPSASAAASADPSHLYATVSKANR